LNFFEALENFLNIFYSVADYKNGWVLLAREQAGGAWLSGFAVWVLWCGASNRKLWAPQPVPKW
jgi:hypothetical protein